MTYYRTLPLDMSLEHANLINSVAMTFKSVGNMINPIVMGFMVKNHVRISENCVFINFSLRYSYNLIFFFSCSYPRNGIDISGS